MTFGVPALISKALVDTGYDLIEPEDTGWIKGGVSGSTCARVLVQVVGARILLAVEQANMIQSIGLQETDIPVPRGMADIGLAHGPEHLHQALRLLRSLQMHPVSILSARVEERLAAIPETERTREVRQRVGQGVFREALLDLWQGRCAVTGIAFPPQLLRASHAKPWAKATDAERLDPFNGLLLSTHLDAMFDSGLIGFDDSGALLLSPQLEPVVRSHFRLIEGSRVRSLVAGHMPYLAWHREHLLKI